MFSNRVESRCGSNGSGSLSRIFISAIAVALFLCGPGGVSGALAEEASATAAASVGTVSINKADVEALQALDGIGESKARAIIAWRESNGGFSSIEQLTQVRGIGEATLAKNRDRLSL